MSIFENLAQLPDDPIFRLPILYAADPRPNKVNLGVGSYRDSEGHTMVLACVKEAEALLPTSAPSKEYLPIQGDAAFIKANVALVFGAALEDNFTGGYFSAQTLGGTGALRIGADFLAKQTSQTIYLPTPTWPNHPQVFARSGMQIASYRYFDQNTNTLDFEGMCQDISCMPPGSTILLHACCHNPSGIDPTYDQWQMLSMLIKAYKLIPFFDLAYQGFSGTPDEDARPLRDFVAQGHELLVANSFSKNFGLYGERVGGLTIVTQDKSAIPKVASHVKQLIRSTYSNPPLHGAQIVTTILQSEALKTGWLEELADMRLRIKEMRLTLISGLQAKDKYKDWNFLARQNGFFSFCGLTTEQVKRLTNDYAIFMPADGRINIAGLNSYNMEYFIDALLAVTAR